MQFGRNKISVFVFYFIFFLCAVIRIHKRENNVFILFSILIYYKMDLDYYYHGHQRIAGQRLVLLNVVGFVNKNHFFFHFTELKYGISVAKV